MGTVFNLCGEWHLAYANLCSQPIKAEVPGCNFLDLMAAAHIPDPFISTNEKKVNRVAEKDWVYSKTFVLNKEFLKSDATRLVCESLDTVAEVFVNGHKVLDAQNCHIAYKTDVKEFLKSGENIIEIYFRSPVNYVKARQKEIKCPRNNNGLTGIPHIRKPQYHFGWDWGPNLPPCGISGKIYLESITYGKITDLWVTQKHFDNRVELNICGEVENFGNTSLEIELCVKLDGHMLWKENIAATDVFSRLMTIKEPMLWQTREWSDGNDQPLYTIEAVLINNGGVIDEYSVDIGLRTIELDRTADGYGGNFCFKLNGKPLFAKGANFIPPDSFITRKNGSLEEYVKAAAQSNFNMLRVWGGGYYGSDELYRLCDRYGILIWQDFMFACQPYPFFVESFTDNVLSEVRCNVKRLRNHPSLCLWCGNNEIEAMSPAWATRKNFVAWTEKFFYHILPDTLRNLDSQTPYIPGSPTGTTHNKHIGSDGVGDTHLWAVWHGLQKIEYYRTRFTRFCSEYGFESLPDIKCIEKFAQKSDYSLTSEVMTAHQKCAGGNAKMMYYISQRFPLPKRFEEYIYLSQVCQEESVRDAAEHWRRNKGRCNGALYWQFNDCWPACSWAGMDYYGNYKALQYSAKHFFSPLAFSVHSTKETVEAYLLNDLLKDFSGEFSARIISFEGKIFWQENIKISAEANSVKRIAQYKLDGFTKICDIKKVVFCAEIKDCRGNTVMRKTLLFAPEKKLELPQPVLNSETKIVGQTAYYTITAQKYARTVYIQTPYTGNLSDNFFDILPGETVTVTQKLSKNASKTATEQLRITCANEIDGSLKTALLRLKILLVPINFFSWLYYKYLV